jgi:hypothetical protein
MPLISLALAAGLALFPQALRADEEPRPNPSMVVNEGEDTWQVRDSDVGATAGVVEFYKGDNEECSGKPLGELGQPNDTFTIEPKTSYRMVIKGMQLTGFAFKVIPEIVKERIRGKIIAMHLSLEPVTGPDAKGTRPKDWAKLHIVHAMQDGNLVIFGKYKDKIKDLLLKFKIPEDYADQVLKLVKGYLKEDIPLTIEGKDKRKPWKRVTTDLEYYQDADSGALWTIDAGKGKKDDDE